MSIIVYEGNERFAYCQGGSRIFFKVPSQDRLNELFAASIVEGKKGEAPAYHNQPLNQRLVVLEAVYGWENVTDRRKQPLSFSRAALEKLLNGNGSMRVSLYVSINNPADHEEVECLDDAAEVPVRLTEPEKNDSGVPQP